MASPIHHSNQLMYRLKVNIGSPLCTILIFDLHCLDKNLLSDYIFIMNLNNINPNSL